MIYKQIVYQKEIKIIKRNQAKILEIKNSITNINNSLEVSIEDLSRQKKQSVNVEIN